MSGHEDIIQWGSVMFAIAFVLLGVLFAILVDAVHYARKATLEQTAFLRRVWMDRELRRRKK